VSEPTTVSHRATINAPASVVFDLIADVEQWPQLFGPAVHAETLERSGDTDVVRRWAMAGGDETVRSWTARRELNREAWVIRQERTDPEPPLRGSVAVWSLEPQGEKTVAELRHEVRFEGEPVREVVAETERNGQAQLDAVVQAAEEHESLTERIISFEDSLFIAGDVADAYQFLYEADQWPQRVDHVSRIDMTERVPNVQFFDMDTSTPDGTPHTTRSVRLCFPANLIVYKQIRLPQLLDAHTGRWSFVETPEGTLATARHTATIKPSALHLLGPDTTVRHARRYLRRVLSANSLNSLRHAKEFAEGKFGV
jgi:C7-C12 aromatase (ARO/CYC)